VLVEEGIHHTRGYEEDENQSHGGNMPLLIMLEFNAVNAYTTK